MLSHWNMTKYITCSGITKSINKSGYKEIEYGLVWRKVAS